MFGSSGALAVVDSAAPHTPDWYNVSPHELIALDSSWTDDVLKVSRRLRAPIVVAIDGERHLLHVVRGPGSLTDELPGIYVGLTTEQLPEGRCSAQLELYGVVFVLEAQLRRVDAHTALCADVSLYCLDRRSVARQRLTPGRAELEWSYVEGDELQIGQGTIVDLTPDSAGIVPHENSAPLPTHTFTALLRLGDTTVPCIAKAQQRRAGSAGRSLAVRLHTASRRQALVRAFLRERLPRLVDRQDLDPEALGHLMADSGYLALRSSPAKLSAWSRLRPDALLSSDCVYRAADGKLLGHASATQIYRRTWLWHQLACLSGHAESGEARLELYLMGAIVPPLYHGVATMTLAYFNQARRWHRLFFSQFVRWLNDASAATICSFDRFERSVELAPEEPALEWELHAANEQELLQVAMLVRAHLPEITADAMDIHPAELRSCGSSSREREVLVLVEDGLVVGAALCELGDPNLSLFNLLNMMQIYLRPGKRRPSPAAQRALLARARRVYSSRGIAAPMVVAPAGMLERDVEPGTDWVEEMGCVVVTGRGLRQFENFCRFHFGRRWRRHSPEAVHELPSEATEGQP